MRYVVGNLTPESSRLLQEIAFNKGYMWVTIDGERRVAKFLDKTTLVFHDDEQKRIYWTQENIEREEGSDIITYEEMIVVFGELKFPSFPMHAMNHLLDVFYKQIKD